MAAPCILESVALRQHRTPHAWGRQRPEQPTKPTHSAGREGRPTRQRRTSPTPPTPTPHPRCRTAQLPLPSDCSSLPHASTTDCGRGSRTEQRRCQVVRSRVPRSVRRRTPHCEGYVAEHSAYHHGEAAFCATFRVGGTRGIAIPHRLVDIGLLFACNGQDSGLLLIAGGRK